MEIHDLEKEDRVYVSGSLREVGSIGRVERVTKCYIIVNGTKFRRDNGNKAGDYDGFHRQSIEPLTEELRIKVKHKVMSSYLNSFGFQDLPLNVLEEIYKKVKETHKKVELHKDTHKSN